MNKIILHPTETSQWHALVNEAQAASRLILNEDTESYLVFLLMRFAHETQWVESVVAFDFLHAMQASRAAKTELLREVGDKSLLFSGLFSEMAQKRVGMNYFTDLGQAAYLSVGELYDEPQVAKLYYELSQQFLMMQQVLQTIRGQSEPIQQVNLETIFQVNPTKQ